ncbi:MAG: SRPBCC family protein [Actinomycetota bacterium]
MGRSVAAAGEVPLQPDAAAELWRDLSRWPSFVEGFARVVEQRGEWPSVDSRVVWESGPGGRGRVTEKVREHQPRRFSTLVYEQRLAGTQTAVFEPSQTEGHATVRVQLDYELVDAGPFSGLTDVLFIRRALRDALARTVRRYTVEAQDQAGLR